MINRYYERLSAGEQKIYNDMINNIESYQTEWSFSQASFDCVAKVYHTVLKDHPEFFWLTLKCSGTTTTRGTQMSVVFKPTMNVEVNRIPSLRRQFDDAAEELIRRARRRSPFRYEQILVLHDQLVLLTEYVRNAPHCYDAYGCMVLHKAVCAGYAAAFQVLMNKLGVECGYITGWSSSKKTGAVLHAWNYIRLNDGYYYVDVTWDDPRMNGYYGNIDNLSHDYFCVNYKEMSLTHRFAEDQFIPTNCGGKCDYYRYRGWYFDYYSFSAVSAIAAKQLRHSDKFSIKFSTNGILEEAKRDLIERQRVFSIPGMSKRFTYSVSKSGLGLSIEKCF